ncbi:unnamed protein product, partial [marine sediment metagenome]
LKNFSIPVIREEYDLFVKEIEETVTTMSKEFHKAIDGYGHCLSQARDRFISVAGKYNGSLSQQKTDHEVIADLIEKVRGIPSCVECKELDKDDLNDRLEKIESKLFRENQLDVDEYYQDESSGSETIDSGFELKTDQESKHPTSPLQSYIVIARGKNSRDFRFIADEFRTLPDVDAVKKFKEEVLNYGSTDSVYTLCQVVKENFFIAT